MLKFVTETSYKAGNVALTVTFKEKGEKYGNFSYEF